MPEALFANFVLDKVHSSKYFWEQKRGNIFVVPVMLKTLPSE